MLELYAKDKEQDMYYKIVDFILYAKEPHAIVVGKYGDLSHRTIHKLVLIKAADYNKGIK